MIFRLSFESAVNTVSKERMISAKDSTLFRRVSRRFRATFGAAGYAETLYAHATVVLPAMHRFARASSGFFCRPVRELEIKSCPRARRRCASWRFCWTSRELKKRSPRGGEQRSMCKV